MDIITAKLVETERLRGLSRSNRLLVECAESGDAERCCDVAYVLLSWKTSPSAREAVHWLKRAIKLGSSGGWARSQLALCYYLGEGTRTNYKTAFELYDSIPPRERDGGDLCNLGWLYGQGKGVRQDRRKALGLYRQAARMGSAAAMTNIARYHEDGRGGLRKSDRQAMRWWMKAALAGDDEAQCRVGYCLHEGEGMRRDFAKAATFYRLAARQEHAPAQWNLGLCYVEGEGVRRSRAMAVKWMRRAAVNGHRGAKRWLAREGVTPG